ncbi:hypothetical protein Syun_014152 [Stephania yunnanensis]|uniref:C2H2-type domain-containing protein n=1 Tax=Stephania yunnanensis TaxID=152371 RepID=A0AAP0JL32_9MAGN
MDFNALQRELKMDFKVKLYSESWNDSSLGNDKSKSSITNICSQKPQLKWDDSSSPDCDMRIDSPFPKFNEQSESLSPRSYDHNNQIKIHDQIASQARGMLFDVAKHKDWDPQSMLSNLSFLEQKIHQLKDLVSFIVDQGSLVAGQQDELVAQQQQLVSADLTSIIVQLISTAGSLLPFVKSPLPTPSPLSGQLGGTSSVERSPNVGMSKASLHNNDGSKGLCNSDQNKHMIDCVSDHNCTGKTNHSHSMSSFDDHESKDEDDVGEGDHLPPGSYEVLQLEKEEILAPHTHFCLICGKGFKRDANLRMHMRGHGDEYKTPAALAKPNKDSSSEHMLMKRYSCPFVGCKRNKEHKKFQPLKTILCVKNHYKRTHCDKSYTCRRCHSKKFSVIADLKTHEKHCGRDKWLCSCGTTFSRKDKLFGHVALFQGHSPALPFDETKGTAVSAGGETAETSNRIGSIELNVGSNSSEGNNIQNVVDVKGGADDPACYFSPLNLDTCNFGGFHEFPRPPFDIPEGSLSFFLSGSCDYNQNNGSAPSSDAFS